MLHKIIKNSAQQILILIDDSNFSLNCTFQLLCCMWMIPVCKFFVISPEEEEVWDREVKGTCWLGDGSKTWNNLMEESADHVHIASSSVCCGSILLEVEVVGIDTKCFQLRKQEVLQHGYVALRVNCNGFLIIIFKEKWSHNPKIPHPTTYCHCRWMHWLFLQFSRIHWSPHPHHVIFLCSIL